jgi:hypothetical protein
MQRPARFPAFAAALTIAATAVAAPSFTAPARAQPALGVGQLEVRAYQPIPKVKTAVQLMTDTHLSRELRRHVMVRLARRGNDVGSSGGNVMRMNVQFRDLLALDTPGGPPSTQTGRGDNYAPGSNPQLDLPANTLGQRRGGASPAPSGTTLRITLTLYSLDGGRVLWQATASCHARDSQALNTGELMIDAIFDDADKNRTGDAGCPL